MSYLEIALFTRVNSFVEALINIVCELKITSGCKKKMRKNFMVIRHSIKELLAKSMVTRPMKCIVGRPCLSSSDVFLFYWAAFLSISLLASVFLPLFFLFFRPCLIHADDTGSRPAAWSYISVQSYSCSLRVFYRTLVVGKDTY